MLECNFFRLRARIMPNNISQTTHSYLPVARKISEASEIEIAEIFCQLRDKR